MPTKRSKATGTSLRAALAQQSRDFMQISEQMSRCGDVYSVPRRLKEIDDLEGTAEVEVPAWRLALALEAIGASTSASQAVNAAGTMFVVNAAGEFMPAKEAQHARL